MPVLSPIEILTVANASGASHVMYLFSLHGRGVKNLKNKAKPKSGYSGKDSSTFNRGGGLCSLQECG